tara:strand:- start:1958 stop:3010 length:1053 start_codon:yes stop_codon:yes gene_type:complete
MSDKSKFEQMLEKLIADDKSAAEEIFHNIVVEKSRSIYEGLLEDDIKDIEVEEKSEDKAEDKVEEKTEDKAEDKEEATTEASKEDKKEDDKVEEKASDESKEDEAVEEASKDEETKEEESKDEEATDESLVDAENSEVAADEAHGGDATDDMMGDIAADNGEENGDDNGDDKGDDAEEIEDRVVDLEDAIDDLKAEFEKMMSDKGEGDDDAEDKGEEEAIVSQDAEGEVEVAPELAPEEVIPAVEAKDNTPKTATEEIREYVNKVDAKHSDGSDNTASPVAKSGGADAKADGKNLVQGGEEKGGKAPMPKEDNAGNVNTPGSKAGSKQSAAKANTADGTDGSAKKSAIGS